MIIDDFDSKTITNLKAALERTAQLFPERLSDHRSRSWLARTLLEVASKGQTRLGPLSEAALSAAAFRLRSLGQAADQKWKSRSLELWYP